MISNQFDIKAIHAVLKVSPKSGDIIADKHWPRKHLLTIAKPDDLSYWNTIKIRIFYCEVSKSVTHLWEKHISEKNCFEKVLKYDVVGEHVNVPHSSHEH